MTRLVRTPDQAVRYVCGVLRTVMVEDIRWFIDEDMPPGERTLIRNALRSVSRDLKRKGSRLRP